MVVVTLNGIKSEDKGYEINAFMLRYCELNVHGGPFFQKNEDADEIRKIKIN